MTRHGKCFNEGFIWDPESGYRAVHTKYYLPNEEGFWEASWYERGENTFTPTQNRQAKIGFLICTEIWFTEHAENTQSKGFIYLHVRAHHQNHQQTNGSQVVVLLL